MYTPINPSFSIANRAAIPLQSTPDSPYNETQLFDRPFHPTSPITPKTNRKLIFSEASLDDTLFYDDNSTVLFTPEKKLNENYETQETVELPSFTGSEINDSLQCTMKCLQTSPFFIPF